MLTLPSRIEPHPTVPTSPDRLRAGYRLAVISHTDDAPIAGTMAVTGVPLDFVVTARKAQADKPDDRLFPHAYQIMGVTKEETGHVGMGQFADLKLCHELVTRFVWIDRVGEPMNADWPPRAGAVPDRVATGNGAQSSM